jgi:hypothetical protein
VKRCAAAVCDARLLCVGPVDEPVAGCCRRLGVGYLRPASYWQDPQALDEGKEAERLAAKKVKVARKRAEQRRRVSCGAVLGMMAIAVLPHLQDAGCAPVGCAGGCGCRLWSL